jgi:hypothetical protein
MVPSSSERGLISTLLIPLIVSVVLLTGVGIFAIWAFMSRQDYKDNSDEKVASAVETAKEETRTEEAARYAEESKEPLKPYVGPAQFGTVRLEYPKTWSAYIVNRDRGSTPVNWYLHPNVVPDSDNRDNVYALRVEVVEQTYDRVLDGFESGVRNGTVTTQPYALPKVPDVVGSRVNGEVERGKQGSMVLFPLRNLTLKVWTESNDYLADFNNIILPNISFVP